MNSLRNAITYGLFSLKFLRLHIKEIEKYVIAVDKEFTSYLKFNNVRNFWPFIKKLMPF